MEIKKAGSQPSAKGPADWFTGTLQIDPLFSAWFQPGEKHWHGAAPTTAMTHIAIQEALDGKVVDWMEKVSDEQFHP